MARDRRKKALYEVIGRGQLKSKYSKKLDKLHPDRVEQKRPVEQESTVQVPEEITGWPTKPKIIQFNAGRINISMPYQLSVAVVLGILLLILIFFRFGQWTTARLYSADPTAGTEQSRQATAGRITEPSAATAELSETVLPPGDRTTDAVISASSNRIVIQQYRVRADLEPVKEYFAGFNIATEIRRKDNSYFLVTREKYDNPNREGTNGYEVKQRIVKLGADYKAPEGYETFGGKDRQPFHDAYGMKFED
ncbi:hypothetical protein ACFL1G_03440 [Planctomycetota bacterium]